MTADLGRDSPAHEDDLRMSGDAKRISTPLDEATARSLRAGDRVLLSGVIYTARDAAHKRMLDGLAAGDGLPFDLTGQVVYYCGPSETPPGHAIGSAGPTTSYRMDAYAPELHRLGLKGTIGKGDRTVEVREACAETCSVYFVAVGGAGALLARAVVESEVVAYEDLGPEAVRRLTVREFPVTVAYDCFGGSVFPGDVPLSA